MRLHSPTGWQLQAAQYDEWPALHAITGLSRRFRFLATGFVIVLSTACGPGNISPVSVSPQSMLSSPAVSRNIAIQNVEKGGTVISPIQRVEAKLVTTDQAAPVIGNSLGTGNRPSPSMRSVWIVLVSAEVRIEPSGASGTEGLFAVDSSTGQIISSNVSSSGYLSHLFSLMQDEAPE